MSKVIDANKPYIIIRNKKPIASFDTYVEASDFCYADENLKGSSPLFIHSTEHGVAIACITVDGEVLRASARQLWDDLPEQIRNGLMMTFQSYGIDPNGHSPFIFWREFESTTLGIHNYNILLDMLVAARYKKREVMVDIARDIVDCCMSFIPKFSSQHFIEVSDSLGTVHIEYEYDADENGVPRKTEKKTFKNVDEISMDEYALYRLDTFMNYLDTVRVEQISQAIFILLSLFTQMTVPPLEALAVGGELDKRVVGILRSRLPTFMEVVKGSEFVYLT